VADRAGLSVERTAAGQRFFAAEAGRIARLCHACAERFEAGARLLAVGATPTARSDARHVAVEFVHPVIVGKRALPALALEPDQLGAVAEPGDIVFAFAGGGLTVTVGEAEWRFDPAVADPFVGQELIETTYHLVWELVHVFFEHSSRSVHDAGASSFLYPFLGAAEDDVEAVIADVRASVRLKAAEVAELREQTLREGHDALDAAAAAIRAGGRVLALGNGGSATDAMDLAADLRAAGRPALDLTEDSGIITAIANDIGVEAIFARQVIAYGRAGDVLVALSTSGNSANVLAALAEARRRGMATVALVGYDGGRVAAEGLADHVVVTRSEHIPRIQEAQASAYHALVDLVR
jgi:D-sedoheptulose 7-phosphate isomerase